MRPVLYVNAERCQTCRKCPARTMCRTRALIQFEPGDLPIIEADRCLGCQVCIKACAFGAIELMSRQQAARDAG